MDCSKFSMRLLFGSFSQPSFRIPLLHDERDIRGLRNGRGSRGYRDGICLRALTGKLARRGGATRKPQ